MSDLPALEPADFAEFFAAVYGHQPFPWQQRLALKLGGDGVWPGVLDLPTGSGKTAAIDLAVFHLALAAGRPHRTAALRIIYVVDRRTIVDQAHDRARRLASSISEATVGILATVRTRLSSYSRGGMPLDCALLRGGIARSDQWARSPDQPLIAVSTVDQVGSRLLFRGYGVSDSMKPVHAGLLGNDALYLLDEVHLSQPFRETLTAIADRYRTWADTELTNPFAVVEMSATPGGSSGERFPLDDEDRAHPLLARRLEATKPTRLVATNPRGFVGEVQKAIEPLLDRPGATVAVVVNRVASAREIHARLSSSLKGVDVELVTGRMRPVDRDALETGLLERVRAGRTRDPEARPLVAVATQCIEAGADFDFDGLVTECASLDALRQRFGRLDRLGDLHGAARGVIIARSDTLAGDPVYGDALGNTWAWLQAEAARSDDLVDLGIGGAVPAEADDLVGLSSPRPPAPVLLPSHLDAWVQTSPKPTPDPDVSLWLHGPDRGNVDVQVVWRADISAEALAHNDEALDEMLIGAVDAMPPVSGEAMAVPIAAVRRWLLGQDPPDVFDVEGAQEPTDDSWKRGHADLVSRRAIAWRGEDSAVVDAAIRGKKRLRPGDTIVVPASYGGIAGGTWDPNASQPVRDVAELATLRQRGRAVLRLIPEVISDLFGADVPAVPFPKDSDDEGIDDADDVSRWLASLAGKHQGDRGALIASLIEQAKSGALRIDRMPHAAPGGGVYFQLRGRRKLGFDGSNVSTEDDQASFTGVAVPLADHLGGVRDVAGELGDRVGLSAAVASDVRLAGRWHDVGKVDPRFQKLLHGGSDFKTLVAKEPLAKSAVRLPDFRKRKQAQQRSKYPPGTRHELMSIALMSGADLKALAADWELVLHLVASHHGRCRPLAPWVRDTDPVDMSWELDGFAVAANSEHGLAQLDSGIADRFWLLVRRYGWWGLAWLETVLRLGDHRRSEEEQQQGRNA